MVRGCNLLGSRGSHETPMPYHSVRSIPPDAQPTAWMREVQREMRAVLMRTRGQGLSVGCLLVQPDGYDDCRSRGDLPGYQAMFDEALRLIRGFDYPHELSGVAAGRRILVLLPYSDTNQVLDFSRRLSDRGRRLRWPEDPDRHASFSMGVAAANPSRGESQSPAMLIGEAGHRLDAALALGGDRIVAEDPLPARRPETTGGQPPTEDHLASGTKSKTDDAMARTLDEMNHVREKLVEASQEGETEYLRRIDVLERRVRKLHEQLQDAEHEPKRRRASDEFHENGRASVYRDVQGLDADDESYDEKLNLLNAIFEANAELRRISEQAQGGPTA